MFVHALVPSDEMEDPSSLFEQEPIDLPVGIEIQNLIKVTITSSALHCSIPICSVHLRSTSKRRSHCFFFPLCC